MLMFALGAIVGGFFSTLILSCFQINRGEKEKYYEEEHEGKNK